MSNLVKVPETSAAIVPTQQVSQSTIVQVNGQPYLAQAEGGNVRLYAITPVNEAPLEVSPIPPERIQQGLLTDPNISPFVCIFGCLVAGTAAWAMVAIAVRPAPPPAPVIVMPPPAPVCSPEEGRNWFGSYRRENCR